MPWEPPRRAQSRSQGLFMGASIDSFGSRDQLMWITEHAGGARSEFFPCVPHKPVADHVGEPIAPSIALTEATSSTTLAKGHGRASERNTDKRGDCKVSRLPRSLFIAGVRTP